MSSNKHDALLIQMFGDAMPFKALLDNLTEQLAEARQTAGLSIRACAAEMNTSYMQVYRLEKGLPLAVTLRSVWAFADATGHDLEVRLVPRASGPFEAPSRPAAGL